MESKLKHGAVNPSYKDGVWYCPYHGDTNISDKNPCYWCNVMIENILMKKRIEIKKEEIRNEQLNKEIKDKAKAKIKSDEIKRNFYVYCKYCETHIKKSVNNGIFVSDGKINTNWNLHTKTKKHIMKKKEWYENTGKSKL